MSALGDALRQEADVASRPGQFSALMNLADLAEKAEAERDKWQRRFDRMEEERDRLRERQESHDLANAAIGWKRCALDAEAQVQAVRALADDWNGHAEWIESNFMPGPNSTGVVGELREYATKVRAALDTHTPEETS